MIATAVALLFTALAGWWLWHQYSPREHEKQALTEPDQNIADTDKLLVAGRYAMAQRDWIDARANYAKALELSPKNTEAGETLSKIEDHLAKAHGGLNVSTDPPGASVYVLGGDDKSSRKELGTTPLKNFALSLGKVRLALEKEGYEPLQKEAQIIEEKTADLGLIELQRSTGTLQILNMPEGATSAVPPREENVRPSKQEKPTPKETDLSVVPGAIIVYKSMRADKRGYYDGHPRSYYPQGYKTNTVGLLRSPWPPHRLIDVRRIKSGSVVRDPSFGVPFIAEGL